MTNSERQAHRILFMGTPDFAVASLQALIQAGFNIVGVVTTPPKASGRGLKETMCAVHREANRHNIPVCAPASLHDPEVVEVVERWNADLGVVVAFKKLPRKVFEAPRLGTFNLHASLLPHYRGAAPINRAIMNGETQTGITTFLLNDNIDEGNIFYRETINIGENETAGDLHDKMMQLGAQLVVKTADDYLNGKIEPKPQANDSDKKAPKIFREDTRIDWSSPVKDIHNHIRGLSPYPGAYTVVLSPKPTEVKIFASKIINSTCKHNAISHNRNGSWTVELSDGILELTEIQPKGKRKMAASDWLNGLPKGEITTD